MIEKCGKSDASTEESREEARNAGKRGNAGLGMEQVHSIPKPAGLCARARRSFSKGEQPFRRYIGDNGSGSRRSDNVSISCPFSAMFVRSYRHGARKSYGHVASIEPMNARLIREPCVEYGRSR